MAAGKVDLVITYGVIPGTTDAFKIGTSGDLYQGDTPWKDMSDGEKESRRVIHSNDGPFSVTRDSSEVKISFSFMTVQENEEDLKDDIQLIETVFSQMWQDVKLEISGKEQYSFSHTDATGFESKASITKGLGGTSKTLDGSFSRNYKVSIRVGLPKDQNYTDPDDDTPVGGKGLTGSTVQVLFNADNKKIVTISGSYTALPTTPAYTNPDGSGDGTETGAVYARDQFEEEIEDYCTAVLHSIGGDDTEFEISFQSTNVPDTVLTEEGIAKGKIITFNRKYVELFFQEGPTDGVSPNTFDASKIKEQSLIITPKRNRSGAQSKSSKSNRYGVPMVSASVVYLCTFDRMAFLDDEDNPTYLTIEDFKEQYDLLRPWLIEKVKETLVEWGKTDKKSFFIMTENVSYNCDAYKLTVNLGVAALSNEGGSQWVTRSLSYGIVRNHGKTLTPIWDKKSSFSRYVFQGAASRTLTMQESWRYVGSDNDITTLWEEPDWKDFAPNKNWKFMVKSVSKDFTPLSSGVPPDNTLMGEYSQKYVVEYYTEVNTAAAKRGQTVVVHREPGRGILGVPRSGKGKFGGD